jgi:hypothetical protein
MVSTISHKKILAFLHSKEPSKNMIIFKQVRTEITISFCAKKYSFIMKLWITSGIWSFQGHEDSNRGTPKRWYPTILLYGVTTQKTSTRILLRRCYSPTRVFAPSNLLILEVLYICLGTQKNSNIVTWLWIKNREENEENRSWPILMQYPSISFVFRPVSFRTSERKLLLVKIKK